MMRRAESAYINHRDLMLYDNHNFESHPYNSSNFSNGNKTPIYSAVSNSSANSSPRINTSRLNKQNLNMSTDKLVVEQVHKSKTDPRYAIHESSQPLNAMRKSAVLSNEVKGMTIGKMMMMSNGERTKLVENRIQDRLLDKKLQEIQKQALKNELQMRRARSLLLDEYIQTKAKNLTINKQINDKPNKVGLQNQFYSPNYLKAKKPVATLSSQDYDEHLEKLKKTAENNRSVCTRHKRHRTGGEFTLNNIEYEKLEKFNQQINQQTPDMSTTAIQTHTNEIQNTGRSDNDNHNKADENRSEHSNHSHHSHTHSHTHSHSQHVTFASEIF